MGYCHGGRLSSVLDAETHGMSGGGQQGGVKCVRLFFNPPVNCECFRISENVFKIFLFVRSGVGLPLKSSRCMVCAPCTYCRGKQQIFSHL